MVLASEFVGILVCPVSKQPVRYVPASGGEDECLFCPSSRLRYRIENGIPVMLVDEAEKLDDETVAQLVARAGG
jgi:uncharacterized protein YbaR (Trm112 family)